MEIKYKKAGIEDIETLIELRKEVLKVVFELPGDTDMSEIEAKSRPYYAESLADGSHVAYMAYDGGEVAGCGAICFYRVMPLPHNTDGWLGYIMNIYTRPEYRKQGVAGSIVKMLIKEANARGIKKITLETTEAARDMYRSLGFEPMKDEMEYKA